MIRNIKIRLRNWWNTSQFPIHRHEDIPDASPWSGRQESIAVLALVTACVIVMLPNLSYPLIEPDETRYAQIALEMNASRDWITPTVDGRPYLDKPPLMYWLTAASFQLFGNNATASRLPSVLSALATIMLTFGLGRRLVGSRAAWFGSIALLLCGGFVLAGRFLILDSLLAFFVVATLLTGYIAVRESHHRWAWWMVSGVACALGVLTKGPVALVLCAPPLIASGWLRRDQTRTRLLHWVAFVAPMTLVCIPWYIAVWKFNPEFGDYFFLEHNVKRFTAGSNHAQAFWFYLPVIFAGMFPASLLLPSLGVFLASRQEHKRQLRSKDLGFLFCSSAWIVGFFSLASCKLPTYILPAIPLVCLMLGQMLDHTVFKPELPNRITAYLKPFPQRANLILVASCLIIVGVDIKLGGTVRIGSAIATVVAIAVVVGTIKVWNRTIAFAPTGWAATSVLAVLLLAFAASGFLPTIAATRSVYLRTARLAKEHPEALIVFFREKPHAASFQLPPQRIVYFDENLEDEFAAFVASQDEVILVTGNEHIESTRRSLAGTHELFGGDDHEHLYLASPVAVRNTRVATKKSEKPR